MANDKSERSSPSTSPDQMKAQAIADALAERHGQSKENCSKALSDQDKAKAFANKLSSKYSPRS